MEHVILVTGVSSGIGRVTAEVLAARGYWVFGTVRTPSPHPPAGVRLLRMDLREETSPEQAHDMFDTNFFGAARVRSLPPEGVFDRSLRKRFGLDA